MLSRSFTLLEVLIAIALLLALLGAMFGFLFDMLSSRARALEYTQQQQAASAMIRQLDSDLMTCIVGDRVSGSGVAGDETHLRVLTRGVASKNAEHGLDDPDGFGDLQLSEYRFNAADKQLQGRRGPARRGAAAQDFEPASGVIHRLRFRYHDGSAWQTSFDSLAADRLPVAVEVAIWFRAGANETQAQLEEVFSPNDALNNKAVAAKDDESRVTSPARGGDRVAASRPDEGSPPPDRIRVFAIPDAASGEKPDQSKVEAKPPISKGGAE